MVFPLLLQAPFKPPTAGVCIYDRTYFWLRGEAASLASSHDSLEQYAFGAEWHTDVKTFTCSCSHEMHNDQVFFKKP